MPGMKSRQPALRRIKASPSLTGAGPMLTEHSDDIPERRRESCGSARWAFVFGTGGTSRVLLAYRGIVCKFSLENQVCALSIIVRPEGIGDKMSLVVPGSFLRRKDYSRDLSGLKSEVRNSLIAFVESFGRGSILHGRIRKYENERLSLT